MSYFNVKVFLVCLKTANSKLYAMKVAGKIDDLENEENEQEALEQQTLEKEVGLFGKECRFLVETLSRFQTKVNRNQ